MNKEDILREIIDHATKNPTETLQWVTGAMVAIAEITVKFSGGDETKEISLETTVRHVTIHAKTE